MVAALVVMAGMLWAADEAPALNKEPAKSALAEALGLVPAATGTPRGIQLKSGDSIVAIGDSITAGGGYLRDIDAVLAGQYPDLKIAKVVNSGVSGQKAEDLIKRFDKDVVARKPAVVSISIGINDVWHRMNAPHNDEVLKAYAENVAAMVDKAQAAGIKVILLAPTIIKEEPVNDANKRLLKYADAMRQISVDKKCQFVDLHAMFLEALKKKPADMKDNWLTKDGVHMKPAGDAIMAIGVLRALGVPDDKIGATVVAPPAGH